MMTTGHVAVYAFIFSLVGLLPAPAGVQQGVRKLFLASDTDHHQWCAYASESSWQSDVKLLGALVVGTLAFTGDRISSIEVTQEDEAGDWIVYDHYTLGANSEIEEDKRKINILPGDRSVEENYLIREGKAKKQSSTTRSLSTGKNLSNAEEWLPKVSVITRLKDFPFSALISNERSTDFSAKDRECTGTKP